MKIQKLRDDDPLYQDIESKIDSIKNKKNLYLIFYRVTKVVVFMAGASITILTGLKISSNLNEETIESLKVNFDNYVLALSAFVTFLAATEGLFSFKDKGKSYDVFLFDLRRLRDRICYDYLKGPEVYAQNKDEHFRKYQEILESQKSIIENSDSGEE